jgi:hypothetical protein
VQRSAIAAVEKFQIARCYQAIPLCLRQINDYPLVVYGEDVGLTNLASARRCIGVVILHQRSHLVSGGFGLRYVH